MHAVKKNMNLRSFATGIAVMVSMTAMWIGKDVYDARRVPRGLYIDSANALLVTHGRALYLSHCASCHGSKLEGQPNWRERREDGRLPAPPHDASGHTWHHPDDILFDITRNGMVPGRTAPKGYVSDMPAYAGILSDDEIMAILAYIKSHWPADVLALQHEVNRQAGRRGQ